MNLVVAKADTVATFDGNNLSYIHRADPMKSAKTKRIECLEMMQDKLYYHTQSHGNLSKHHFVICSCGLDDGTVLVAIWLTPDAKTKLHQI